MWLRRRLSKGNYFGISTGVAEPELNAGKEKDAGAWQVETQKQQPQEWRPPEQEEETQTRLLGSTFSSLLKKKEKKKKDRRQKRIEA